MGGPWAQARKLPLWFAAALDYAFYAAQLPWSKPSLGITALLPGLGMRRGM